MLQRTPISVGLGHWVPLPVLLGKTHGRCKTPSRSPLDGYLPNSADLPVAAAGILAASGITGGSEQQQPMVWEPMARPGGSALGGSVPAAPQEGPGQAGQRCAPQHHCRHHGNCRMTHSRL